MDSDTEELNQLAADAEAILAESKNADEEPSGVTQEYLAESVLAFISESNKMQKETRSILASIQEAPKQISSSLIATHTSILQPASASIEAASQQMALTVDSSLQQLENQKQKYQKATAELRSQNQRDWMTLVGGALVLGSIAFSLLYFWLWPSIDESKAYAKDHRALEASSVYGARVVENPDGQRFVVFDDGVEFGSCNQPSCIEIITK